MRILHTADWHLADRLGRVDRTEDLRRAVERVAEYCRSEQADVLLVAGDLFSEMARPDGLRESVRHLQETFAPFLTAGGTILALTGNHDNEGFCQTLRHAMSLAAPTPHGEGELLPSGRLYLTADPALIRLADPSGGAPVQFVLMPYPTPSRFLRDPAAPRYGSLAEKNEQLIRAFSERLRAILAGPHFRSEQPAVLGAHVHVRGANLASLFRLSEEEDFVFAGDDLFDRFAYVALGHIHRAQAVAGRPNVRYSGSIERMDLGEKDDAKGVVLAEVGPAGLVGTPATLPLPATPVYEVTVLRPADDIPRLRETYADAKNDLVNIHLSYTAGEDNLEEALRQLQGVFPRWYARDWTETGALRPSLVAGPAGPARSFAETVREYLEAELQHHPDDERAAVLARAEELLRDEA
jgi:exonuclease SbcD